MRIAHLLDVRWNSGVAHYALTLAQGQKAAGHDVQVWAPSGVPAFELAAKKRLATVALDRPWLGHLALREAVRSEGIEILNAHTGRTHTLAVFLARGTHAAVIRTRTEARTPQPRPGADWLYARTAGFIAANGLLLRAAEAASKLPPARAAIHEGLPLDAFHPSEAPENGPVGIVGRLDPVKGHEDVLRAAARVPKVRFEAAGADANLKRADLERRAAELGLAGRFTFRGFVADVPGFVASCGFGIVASKGSEAVSRAALEWMAAGRALVATTAGALPELVVDGQTGFLVAPGDPAAMAGAIEKLASTPGLAAMMGKAARRRLVERFGLETFVAETEKLYRAAAAAQAAA